MTRRRNPKPEPRLRWRNAWQAAWDRWYNWCSKWDWTRIAANRWVASAIGQAVSERKIQEGLDVGRADEQATRWRNTENS